MAAFNVTSPQAQRNNGIEVSSWLMKYSSTLGAENFPEVSLPAHPGQHHLLGGLSAVNSILSQKGINIAGQCLQTNNKIRWW